MQIVLLFQSSTLVPRGMTARFLEIRRQIKDLRGTNQALQFCFSVRTAFNFPDYGHMNKTTFIISKSRCSSRNRQKVTEGGAFFFFFFLL